MIKRGLLLSVLFCLSFVAESEQINFLVDAAIERTFLPAANELAQSADHLFESVNADCHGETSRDAFIEVVHRFSIMEYYRLGQINQKNRAERLFFWPDRKGTGQKQLRRLLADPARGELTVAGLAKKSVALQGLPALERIVFSSVDERSDLDCAVARTIAENIRNISREVQSDWKSEQGIAWQLRHVRQDSLYRTSEESVAAVLTVVKNSLSVMTEKKLPPLLVAFKESDAVPKSAPFWRSKQTLQNLRGNLLGVERLLLGAELAQSTNTEDQIAFELRTGLTMLDAAAAALSSADGRTARDRLAALQSILLGINTTVVDVIAPRLGVVTGFNAGDGD